MRAAWPRPRLKPTRLWRAAALALALLAALRLAGAAAAQDATPVTDDEVNRVAKQLYCPVCQNVPLDVCPTQACAQWRATIREKLEAGWSDQQILDFFVAQFGERVLARPSTRGINILVWVIPPLLLAGGGLLLWRHLRSLVPNGPPPAAARPPAADAEYSERLERELRKRL